MKIGRTLILGAAATLVLASVLHQNTSGIILMMIPLTLAIAALNRVFADR